MDKAIKKEKEDETFEGVRRKLLEIRRDLMRESQADIGQMLNKDDKYNGASDDGDFADVACRDSIQATQCTRHRAQLRAIEEALLRIDEGTYGTCGDCGEKISLGRLNVLPFALRCVDCQESYEIMGPEPEE